MKIEIKPGTYVVAVSGGVDSMVLLDLLSKKPKLKLIVAHFDHGIRPDSINDRQLVKTTAKYYNLPFIFDAAKLGPGVSEAKAREARYKFLEQVKQAAGAKAIITAHHQDDLIETAIINLIRGTNRLGLSSLQNRPGIERPLLNFAKAELIKHAKDQGIIWHEDSTNQDDTYLRNYVRHSLMPKFSAADRQAMLNYIVKVGKLNKEIDEIINQQIKNQTSLNRHWFIMLEHNVSRDVMATWLRNQGARDVDRKQLEILVQAAKTFSQGKKADVDKHFQLVIKDKDLALTYHER